MPEYKAGNWIECQKSKCKHRWRLREDKRPGQCPKCHAVSFDKPDQPLGRPRKNAQSGALGPRQRTLSA